MENAACIGAKYRFISVCFQAKCLTTWTTRAQLSVAWLRRQMVVWVLTTGIHFIELKTF